MTKLRTVTAFGFVNGARVVALKLGLRSGSYPSLKFFGISPQSPILDLPIIHLQKDLKTRSDWTKGQGRAGGKQIAIATIADSPPDWLAVPKINARAISDQPWRTIADFDPKAGGVKTFWELSRFDWVIPLAEPATLGNATALTRMNIWLKNWAEQNLPNLSTNWKCGHKASIRLMHMLLVALVFGQTIPPNGLMRLPEARIEPKIRYAIGHANNHGETKSATLFIEGGLLDDKNGRVWSEIGRHWQENLTQDPAIGGGRIIGEACHYIDLMRFLAGAEIVSVQARAMGDKKGVSVTEDKAAILLGFADGSFGTIHYLANGAASFPKERIELFAAGRTLQLDNFLKLKGFGWPGFKASKLWRQDKGQNACAAAFIDAVRKGDPCPIPANELFEVARVTIEVAGQLRSQN